jgi:hypothetical protein
MWEKKEEKRAFWVLASFRLSYRSLRTCSFAKASPKHQKSSLHMATAFLQMLKAIKPERQGNGKHGPYLKSGRKRKAIAFISRLPFCGRWHNF